MKKLLPILTLAALLTAVSLPGDIFSKDLSRKSGPAGKPPEGPTLSLKPVANAEMNRFDLLRGNTYYLNPFFGYKGLAEIGFSQSQFGKNFITVHTLLTFHHGNSTLLVPRTFLLPASPEINFLPRKPNMCYMYWNN